MKKQALLLLAASVFVLALAGGSTASGTKVHEVGHVIPHECGDLVTAYRVGAKPTYDTLWFYNKQKGLVCLVNVLIDPQYPAKSTIDVYRIEKK